MSAGGGEAVASQHVWACLLSHIKCVLLLPFLQHCRYRLIYFILIFLHTAKKKISYLKTWQLTVRPGWTQTPSVSCQSQAFKGSISCIWCRPLGLSHADVVLLISCNACSICWIWHLCCTPALCRRKAERHWHMTSCWNKYNKEKCTYQLLSPWSVLHVKATHSLT